MNQTFLNFGQRFARQGAAVGAAIVLVTGGATWAIRADAQSKPAAVAEQQTQPASTPSSRAAIGARESYADIVKAVAPAVVTIRTEGRAARSLTQFQFPNDEFLRRFFGDPDDPRSPRQPREFRQRGLGSGVIVSSDGYILTNHHVVDDADEIRAELTDGRSLVASLVGTDEPSDLALLKISASNLHFVPLGNSDAVEVGDVVLAMGNPLGVGQTVTMGIVSAKGRAVGAGSGSYEEFLQTDAPINQGNSGGALVNLKGEVIGINSQIVSQTGGNIGIGFAIPSNMAKHVMDELRTNGKVTRAQLGVSVQPVTSDLAESLGLKDVGGALVGSVTPGSAADGAGIKRGDVIRSFNGLAVTDTNTLRNRVAESKPGSTAQVGIVRDGKEQTIAVTLDELAGSRVARNGGRSSANDQAALGVAVAPLTPELASRYQLPRGTQGLVVQEVDPDGRAASAGIRPGDVIEEINRRPVGTIEDLRSAIRESADRPVLLLINRQGSTLFVTVRPDARG